MKPLRCVLYARVSTQDQSTEMQKTELAEFAKARGFEVSEIYEDTRTGTNTNRPALKKLRQDAFHRKFDVVLVYKFDRVARSLKDILNLFTEFEEYGVKVISVKDNIDMTTSTGKLMFSMVAAFAEFEASIIRERVISGLKNAKARGQQLGRPRQINVIGVMELHKQPGMSVRKIAAQLGVSRSAVHEIIKSQKETA